MGDIVLVVNAVGDETRIGIVVEVNKASVKVKFGNSRINVFAKAGVILLVRPPRNSQERAMELKI